jgi:signal transduction histidine kinase
MRHSLFIRLVSASAVLIALALILAGFGLRAIFDREIERRAAEDLMQIVKTLAAQVRIDARGEPVLDAMRPDPRFDTPYGGRYWQIGAPNGKRIRSRSLWDFVLTIPNDRPGGERWITDVSGPNHSTLLAAVQDVTVSSARGEVPLQIVAAADRSDFAEAQRSFLRLLILSLAALGIILIAAMSVFIRLALRPFDELGRGLQTVHSGASRQLRGRFPQEVQPVVDDLNRMIAFQDAAVDRAKTHAADLAHGLKTPLAVLDALARQATADGRNELAAPINEQVGQMQRQVERVLARARAGITATLGQKRIDIAPVAEKIVRVFSHLPDTRPVKREIDVAQAALFPGEEHDLTEILGNLIDNARKWAKSHIRLTARTAKDILTLSVEDDGPGLSLDQAANIARGQRWDESQPGTGFGVAITRDLTEGYHGTLEIDRSEFGGLRASVTIPLRPHAP